jgi:pimeloyl-ACP methyl ester carboxylesterase
MPIAGELFYFASKQGVATKPAVVLIHGAGGDHLHWPYNIRRMGDYRVFAPDLPGHGKSEGIGEQTIDGYAKIIADWLIEIGIHRAVFVGHSMGGAIAQTLALDYPDLVRGVVLVSTGTKLGVNPDLLEKLSVPAAFPKAMELIVKWSFSKNADVKLIEQVKKSMLETRPTVVYGDFVACGAFDLDERVKKIKAPACVICGTEDKMTPVALSEGLAEQIPGSSLVTIEGAGHMVMIEESDEVAAVIRGFLEKKVK